MKYLTTILFIITLLIKGSCCECIPTITIEQGYFIFDFVATGKVIKVYNQTKDNYRIDFEIDKLIKGDSITSLTVYSTPEGYFTVDNGDTLMYWTSIDRYLHETERWIIFASKDSLGEYGFGYCAPSRELTSPHVIESINNIIEIENYFFRSYELDLPYLLTQDFKVIDTILINNLNYNEESYLTVKVDENGFLIQNFNANVTDSKKQVLEYLRRFEPFRPAYINGNKIKVEYFLNLKSK
ncbi:MAG: hypothetical protein JEY96_19575 [Bacteroidales bacterium]|nr:hypothetical protein [Bacteroidales bacterium]